MTRDVSTRNLGDQIQAIADAESGPKWGLHGQPRKPERWWDNAHWRCLNGHVSTSLLGTENGRVCLACQGQVWLTFPEDRDGDLVIGAPNCDLCANTRGGRMVHERGNGVDVYTCDTCGHTSIDIDEDDDD